MAIIWDCHHSVGILFSMKHLFSIVSNCGLWDQDSLVVPPEHHLCQSFFFHSVAGGNTGRFEQSFRHNKHTHTNQNAATDKHSRHNH